MRRLTGIAMFCLFASALYGQSSTATVTGRFTDPTREIIVDAKVTLINQGTNVQHAVTSNLTGSYFTLSDRSIRRVAL